MDTAHLFDAASVLILVTLALVGLMKGFIGALMSFVGLFCGSYCAWVYQTEGTALFLQYFDFTEPVARVITMALIFLGVAILASFISRALIFFVKLANLSGLNRLIGMLMGLAAGTVLILIAYAVVDRLLPDSASTWMYDSIFVGLAEQNWPYFDEFLRSFGVDIAGIISRT